MNHHLQPLNPDIVGMLFTLKKINTADIASRMWVTEAEVMQAWIRYRRRRALGKAGSLTEEQPTP